MISFKNIRRDTLDELSRSLGTELSSEGGKACPEQISEIREIISEVAEQYCEEGALEAAAAVSCGALLIRLFEYGRYSFVYPIPVFRGADILAAVRALRDYAVYEELPFVLSDVPREDISELSKYFHRYTAESSDGESFTLGILGILPSITSVPRTEHGRITLDELCEDDVTEYAELCRDRDLNRHWGYDYSVDYPDADGRFFFDAQREEFRRGVSMSLAVRTDGRLIGEAVLHAEDLEGGIECAFRLFKRYHGKGLGRETLEAALLLCERLGYSRVVCRVLPENLPSRRLLASVMRSLGADGTVYEKKLREE